MHCKIEEKAVQEIAASNIVQQTSFWAQVKAQQEMIPIAFQYQASDDLISVSSEGDRNTQDDVLVLIRNIDNESSFAYVPYGPKTAPDIENYGLFLEELSEALRPYLPKNCILIRYDLPWENPWAKEDDYFDEQGNWLGPPSHQSQEFRINFNTQTWNLVKSRSDILPTNTIFLNLNQSEEKLLQKMKPKTRYNIRLSEKKGINVQEYGIDQLDLWYSIYQETALRNNITLHAKEYFYTVLSQQNEFSQDVDPKLLMADHGGDYLAAMFLILSKRRGTYLYGASSAKKRNLMATYAIQWEAIKIAKEAGCREYDMFGTAPNANPSHPMHGLYRFKRGFGGNMFHRMGCWDYPLDKKGYSIFRALEINNQSYHSN
ncbi:MAG: peptidoglycan bridge formation glycyltransferase FemA/FemB family protein [Bacteroidales bacterium]|nr:peptidoglycan bridge formation glycyltransferase FemA/FemB family protein [Bacteroidales bacterium]